MKSSNRVPASHAHHDRVLVARFAADDAYAAEVDQARALMATCAECAELAGQIRLLSSATAEIEAPRRSRDFLITPEQAERLRGSRFERVLRRLAAPGLAPVRPLAGVALSLGLVLAVVGAAMPQAAGVPVVGLDSPPQVMEPRSGAHPPLTEYTPTSQATDGVTMGGSEYQERFTAEDTSRLEHELADTSASGTRDALIMGGLLIALISLGALLLVIGARRRMSDPLLR